jgi:type I restriction enzyme S subunit
VHRLRKLSDEIVPEFYMYWMQLAVQILKLYIGNESTTTIPNLSIGKLKSFNVPFPPKVDQELIAAKVQKLMAEVTKLQSAIQKQQSAIDSLPSSYLNRVFNSPEAKKWERKKLGEICEIYSNHITPNSDLARSIPYIGLEQVESGTGRIIDKVNDPDGMLIQSMTFRFNNKHVLYGKLRPYLNKVATPDFEGRCTTELLPLLPKDNCIRDYLALLLRRSEAVEEAMREKTGSKMPRADMKKLFKMIVPVPPLPDQKRIVSNLQTKISEVEKLKSALSNQKSAIATLPQSILRKAFTGSL